MDEAGADQQGGDSPRGARGGATTSRPTGGAFSLVGWACRPGNALLATSAIHEMYGLADPRISASFFRGLRAGFDGARTLSGGDDASILAATFFHLLGISWAGTGALMNAYEDATGRPVPPAVGVSLVGAGALGAYVAPASGFWILIGIGAWMLRRAATFQEPSRKDCA